MLPNRHPSTYSNEVSRSGVCDRIGTAVAIAAAVVAINSSLHGQTPPVCTDPCPVCVDKMAGNGGSVSIRLESVDFDTTGTTFTYRLCQDPGSQNLSHWVLGLSETCCDLLAGSTGGTSTPGACLLDPTTNLFGLKFETSGGVASCDGLSCAGGGDLFSVTLQGNFGVGCIAASSKINGGDSVAFGCLQGPACDCEVGAVTDRCPDCNHNGVRDDQDIANCVGTPDCDDCNLNGVPDECDIATGASPDADGDGVPDECVQPPAEGGSWSDDIWNLGGDTPYPDDGDGVPDLHVTIDAAEVFLDVTVSIPTLRLLNGAVLLITQSPAGGGAAGGALGAGEGDLIVTEPGGIFAEGSLVVDHDRQISVVEGSLTLGDGGHYQATSEARSAGAVADDGGFVTASLTAVSILLLPTACGQEGQMSLLDQMTVETAGDFVMDGTGVLPCSLGGGSSSVALGGQTPPSLKVFGREPEFAGSASSVGVGTEFTQLTVGGSYRILEAAIVCIGCESPVGSPVPVVLLTGDFDNQSRFPSLFNWDNASLQFLATTTGEPVSESLFEVAGLDFGQTFEGFSTEQEVPPDVGPHTNFSMGKIQIDPGHHVTFVNEHDNTNAAGPCAEALYVDRLVLGDGSAITLDNVRVYYITLEDNGATIQTVGECAGLLSVCVSSAPAVVSAAKNRYVSFEGQNAGTPTAIRVTLRDLPAPFDRRNGLTMWVGAPHEVSQRGGSVLPSAGFGTLQVAQLQCDPFYTDWSAQGTVHIYHQLIVPGGIYELQAIADRCAASDADNFSAVSDRKQSRWGDIVGLFRGGQWTDPDGQVNFTFDLVALVDAFAGRPTAPSKVRADLEPATPNQIISIGDISLAVDAFRGIPYPFQPVPNPCR